VKLTPELLVDALLEADRLAFLRQKYIPLVQKHGQWIEADAPEAAHATLNGLIAGDPTSRVGEEDGVPVHAGNYSEWIIKRWIEASNKHRFTEDLYKVKDDLALFHRFKGRLPVEARDINKIKTTDQLYQLIKPFEEEAEADEQSKLAKRDLITLIDDEDVMVVIPKTYEAGRIIGNGTRWCTAANSDYGQRHFQNYSEHGPLIQVWNKKMPDHQLGARLQLHFETGQFMNEDDRAVDLDKALHPKAREAIKQYFLKIVEQDPEEIKRIGAVVQLGGMEDVQRLMQSGAIDPISAFQNVGKFSVQVTLVASNVVPLTALVGLSKKDRTVLYTEEAHAKGGYYLLFDDYSDPDFLDFFDDSGRRGSAKDWAEKLFAGDGEFFVDNSYWDVNDHFQHLSDENKENIKRIMLGREIELSDFEEPTVLTPALLEEYDIEDIVEENKHGESEDIVDELERAARYAMESGMESEHTKVMMDEWQSVVGKLEYNKEIGKYAVFQTYKDLISWAQQSESENPDDYCSEPMTLAKTYITERANPNTDNIYGEVDDDYYNELVSEHLHELLKNVEEPTPPAQPTPEVPVQRLPDNEPLSPSQPAP
jgi:hypothetical protein